MLDRPHLLLRSWTKPLVSGIAAKELGVPPGNIPGAHDVAHDEDVLRLGDDRLGVACVVPVKQALVRQQRACSIIVVQS